MNMKLPQDKFSTWAPGNVLGSSELSMSEGHAHNAPHLSAGHALDTGARRDLLEQYSLWSSCRVPVHMRRTLANCQTERRQLMGHIEEEDLQNVRSQLVEGSE